MTGRDAETGLYSDVLQMRRRMEQIGDYVKEVESRLSVHDSIMYAASAGVAEISEINEAIYYARDALLRLSRISEAMESIGGEVTRLKWELCRMKRSKVTA